MEANKGRAEARKWDLNWKVPDLTPKLRIARGKGQIGAAGEGLWGHLGLNFLYHFWAVFGKNPEVIEFLDFVPGPNIRGSGRNHGPRGR